MNKFRSASVITLLGVLIVALSCVDHTLPPAGLYTCDVVQEVSFATDIAPIIAAKCAITGDGGCHNGGNGPSRDWRVFSNFQSHAAIVKDRVTRPVGEAGHMPKIGLLSDQQIKLLVCWVDQGAEDN